MHFAAALSTAERLDQAIDDLSQQIAASFRDPADLAVVFVSHSYQADYARLAADLRARFQARVLIGCTGESIVGTGREVEGEPAISLWLAKLPGVSIEPFHLEFERTPDGGMFTGWPEPFAVAAEPATLLVLGEPFSFPADFLLTRLADEHLRLQVLGGMASGAASPGENRVLWNEQAYDSGAVAVRLSGPVQVRAIVSQGCRPIGQPYIVTRADRNIILELGGRPALARLQETFDTLSAEDQQLVRHGVHVGRVINEYQERFARGDFLVRNCIGADRETGSIAVGDFLRVGQTVQFHVRDATSADEELRELLRPLQASCSAAHSGALLFTCNGRGTRMFPTADHDAGVVREVLGPVPTAGLFAQGELGPIGGKNFLHGFTASVAIFGPADTDVS